MKTKKLTKIAGVITLLACIWGGVSCEQNLPEETYTVTFDSDGGSEIKPVPVKDGEKVTKPADPTKDGYTFKGWFNGDKEYDFETAVTADITLKAKWEAGTFTVTFDSDGGSKIEPVTVKDGEKVTKPAADPTKTGYTFKGWFIGDKDYDFETAVTSNITLKAKWEVVTYTVKFDSDGGSVVESAKVNHGEKVKKPADPTKTGYTFKGWLNGETVYDFEKAVTADITLKAKWEVVTYTVTFNSDGGSVVESAVVKDGAKVPKPADPTKTGYTFKGWLDGETVYDFEKAVTANITLKANWEVVTYNITYELNGGTGDEGNPKTYTIETADFTIKNLVSGPAATPNFAGWYSDKDLTKPAVTTITKGSTGDLSFYAKWSDKATFTVTFKFVGVEESASVNVEEGKALTSEQLESVKSKISSDYEFVDFYTNQECTNKFDLTTKVTANSTLYVKVNEIKKFTVTFNSNDGSVDKSATVKDGEKVTKPADPTRTGYTFKGWFDGDDKEYDFEKAVTADITLKAKWEENTYTVTFDSGVTSQTIKYNGTATEPTAPTKEGFNFVGWYEGDTKFDFATKITKDISLTAKWEEVTFTVTFDSGVTSQTIKYNGTAEEPTAPTKDGYDFVGWYEADGTKFDFATKITKNISLTAKWEETNYSYVLENLNKEECSIPTTTDKNGGSFGLYYSETGVAVNIGDKVYFQGTLTFNEALDAKQLYIQTNLNGWNNQAGQVWNGTGIDEGSYNFAVAYDVTAPESLTHVQIAIGNLLKENGDLKVTVKDFYVVHIAKENIEKVFPFVYSTTESPVVLNLKTGDGADGKTYETNINKNSVAFAAGDTIEFSIEIPKGADITGAQQVWMQTAADNWGWHSMLYSANPYTNTTDDLLGVVTATCSAAIDIDSINLNYGIQKKEVDSNESFSLPITKVTLRKIPKFTSNK